MICFFPQGDAFNGYWGITVTLGPKYKTAFVASEMQYFTKRIPQGMPGSSHTYCAERERDEMILGDEF